MQYTIIDSKELAELFKDARIQLQQDWQNSKQETDISSMQENCAFMSAISTYLATHHLRGSSKALLIDELTSCIRLEISADYQLSEADYKTIFGVLLGDY